MDAPKGYLAPIAGAGYVLLGGAFLVQGTTVLLGWWSGRQAALIGGAEEIGQVQARNQRDPRLGESLQDAVNRTRGTITKTTMITQPSIPIKQRAGIIARMMKEGSLNSYVRETALGIVSRNNGREWEVPPKDWRAEVKAVFSALTDPSSPISIRYTKDHARVDQFQAAEKTLKLRAGDCDDFQITGGACLMSIGYEVWLAIMQAKGAPDWSHIFLYIPAPSSDSSGGSVGDRGDGMFLDMTMPQYQPGWCAPGFVDTLRDGKPHGQTVKAVLFRLK